MYISRPAILTIAIVVAGAALATGIGQASARQSGTACHQAWHLVPLPASMTNSDAVMTGGPPSVVSASDVWLGTSDGSATKLVRWNGASATEPPQIPAIPGPTGQGSSRIPGMVAGQVLALTSFDSATDGWVTGSYVNADRIGPTWLGYAAHWQGGRWTYVPLATSDRQGISAGVDALAALSPDNAWAVGAFWDQRHQDGAITEHWDGTQWSLVPNPADTLAGARLYSVSATSPSDVWAVGSQRDSAGQRSPLIEHWDGTRWSVIPAPAGADESELYSVSADGAGDAWAVGGQDLAQMAGTWHVLAEHWDGSSWRVVPGLPDFGLTILGSVYAASPTDVWATTYANSQGLTMFTHWDGKSWTSVPAPGPKAAMSAYRYDGTAYDVGGVSGKGDDIWASGWIEDETTGLGMAQLAHLSCARD